ncbi:MAG: hypothetical protein ACTSWE_00040 [Promethearchaeota archaeon]
MKAGIDALVSDIVNRFIDYGAHCGLSDPEDPHYYNENDPTPLRQLKYFYKKDKEKNFSSQYIYVKALYLHHLLDFFRETRTCIYDFDSVFHEFLLKKIPPCLSLNTLEITSFTREINDIFSLLKNNKKEFLEDLKENSQIS